MKKVSMKKVEQKRVTLKKDLIQKLLFTIHLTIFPFVMSLVVFVILSTYSVDLDNDNLQKLSMHIIKEIAEERGLNEYIGGTTARMVNDIRNEKYEDALQVMFEYPFTQRGARTKANIGTTGLLKYTWIDKDIGYPILEPENAYVTQEFTREHHALDINNDKNSGIIAVYDGIIHKTGYDKLAGNYIMIKHKKDGVSCISTYCHLEDILVKKDDIVLKGFLIGVMGNTGENSQGRHLHFTWSEWNKQWKAFMTKNLVGNTILNDRVEVRRYKGII